MNVQSQKAAKQLEPLIPQERGKKTPHTCTLYTHHKHTPCTHTANTHLVHTPHTHTSNIIICLFLCDPF